MKMKAKVLTLAILSTTMQYGQILAQGTDQGYYNQGYYNQNQGYYNQNPNYYGQGQNPGYVGNPGYNVQVNEDIYRRGNNEGLYHEGYNHEGYNHEGYNHEGNRTNRMYNQNRDNRNSRMNEHGSHMRNARAEADFDGTPHSYPLNDEGYRNTSNQDNNNYQRNERNYTAYRNRSQNNQNRQYISDNTSAATGVQYGSAVQNNEKAKGTIVEVLTNDPSFSTLVRALTAAGLIDTLNGKGPFTVFAPNNEAFKKLSSEQLQDLLKPENKQKLIDILKYHVIPGKVMSADLVSAKTISLQGKPLELKVNGKKATINNANITNSDLSGTNGVVHIIDTVLIPN